MEKNKINLEAYFKKGNQFEIPAYQRGYKWAVKDKNGKSSVDFFCDSIIDAFRKNLTEYFIEAVTVVREYETAPIILVDGQQRTTTLFLMFVVLEEVSLLSEIFLKYTIREDSHKYLENIYKASNHRIENENTQDIFYFKEAISTISEKFKSISDRPRFIKFLKENVFLLFNVIPQEKAVNTFIALNGLKAIMKEEELIKSEMLIKSSRATSSFTTTYIGDAEMFAIEWKINEDRSMLARNWDKWLYWWNQKEVKEYFGIANTQHPLYYLLVTYWNINKRRGEFAFQNFKNQFIRTPQNAKLNFEGLRKLQKTFEDLYGNPKDYNFLGIILKTSYEKENAIRYFVDNSIENKVTLEEYSKWSLVNTSHADIINDTKTKGENNIEIAVKNQNAQKAIELIAEKYVYWDANNNEFKDRRKEYAYRFLLLLNLLEDNKLRRKFDFSIWNNRSLEHIYPKSKQNELNFNQESLSVGSIHCIGNLVLLYGNNNSEFGAKDVIEKKKVYFDTGNRSFNSRSLLHSLSVFAYSDWKEAEIIANLKEIIATLKQFYGINK